MKKNMPLILAAAAAAIYFLMKNKPAASRSINVNATKLSEAKTVQSLSGTTLY